MASEPPADAAQDWGGKGQRLHHHLEEGDQLPDNKDQEDGDGPHSHQENERWIDQGGPHLAIYLVFLLREVRQPGEDARERPCHLPGPHHADVEGREDPWIDGEGFRKTSTISDAGGD